VAKIEHKITERQPVVAVMGHIDHGKSTLLDYIRKTNITEKEAGGITQHISAYEVSHKNKAGVDKKITFLDTPGHEAFKAMRSRGADAADIAILVVAADDGVKAQTIEAYQSIENSKTPYIVAINKIDKPNADIERVKQSLAENNIYLEGYGGHVSFVPVSSKTGEGIDELLEIILLSAEIENFQFAPDKNAEGVVIESNLDQKRGLSATLLIKDGTLKSGNYVIAEDSFAPVRIMENFLGKTIKEAMAGEPVRIIGFSNLPATGSKWIAVKDKKEAEAMARDYSLSKNKVSVTASEKEVILPIVIKADVSGVLEAIEHELEKIESAKVGIKILLKGTGDISENDIKTLASAENPVAVGFNVKVENSAKDVAERFNVKIGTFKIIYELVEWIKNIIDEITPTERVEETVGAAKILRTFSRTKDKQIIGARLLSGEIKLGDKVKIMRREAEISKGKVVEVQVNKLAAPKVSGEGSEFGAKIEATLEIAPGDYIESFSVSHKK